jgi:ubiquinone/menaquinone biosynthesis C-methylase UbiE
MSHKKTARQSLDIVYVLEYGVWKATALYTGLELDVFTMIDRGNHTLDSITSAVGGDHRGLRILLGALCSLKLLRKCKGDYFLTNTSEHFLVRGRPAYYGDWCLYTQLAFDTRSRLADGIRTSRAVGIDASKPDSDNLWKCDTSRALYTWPLEAKLARQMWRKLGISNRIKTSLPILDVACGTAVNSFALAQTDLNTRITALDFPHVLEVTRLIAQAMGVAEQVDFYPGDATTSDLGTDHFDIVFLGKILYYFDVENAVDILRRVHSALKKNGLVVINTYINDDRSCKDQMAMMAALQLYIFAPHSHVYNFSEYRNLLKQAGFNNVVRHTNTLITAKRTNAEVRLR